MGIPSYVIPMVWFSWIATDDAGDFDTNHLKGLALEVLEVSGRKIAEYCRFYLLGLGGLLLPVSVCFLAV